LLVSAAAAQPDCRRGVDLVGVAATADCAEAFTSLGGNVLTAALARTNRSSSAPENSGAEWRGRSGLVRKDNAKFE
jgi:hypothetical protein